MSDTNFVILIGRVGRDAELRYTQGGQPVANWSLATSGVFTKDGQKQERTEWHNIVTWGKQAETAGKYVKKGRLLSVEGKLTTRDWTDDKGVKHYKTEIVAYKFGLLDKPTTEQAAAVFDGKDEYELGDLGPPLE